MCGERGAYTDHASAWRLHINFCSVVPCPLYWPLFLLYRMAAQHTHTPFSLKTKMIWQPQLLLYWEVLVPGCVCNCRQRGPTVVLGIKITCSVGSPQLNLPLVTWQLCRVYVEFKPAFYWLQLIAGGCSTPPFFPLLSTGRDGQNGEKVINWRRKDRERPLKSTESSKSSTVQHYSNSMGCASTIPATRCRRLGDCGMWMFWS